MTAFDLNRLSASCRLDSRSRGGGFAASGRASFVAAAAVGSLVAESIRRSSDYDDCMIASGAVINDGKPHPELDGVMLASAAPSPAPVPAVPVRLNEPAAVPATLEAEADIPEDRSAAGRRAVRRADTWLRAQDVLNRSDRKSRDLYLVLCGAGDRSSCVMAAALGRT